MNREIEVLAPAGSIESLYAAVAAGADAVYIGGRMFGARAFAQNLSEEEMLRAIDFVHLHGRKIYMTVNTLLKEEELTKDLYQYLLPYYKQGLDAVIVQDLGVFRYIRMHFPDLPIHASTQMTITGADGARFIEGEGATRVVPARELTLQEVRKISEQTNLEIECFVHGALCYCYSGQCLLSSFVGGRSGNRGQCAQPCRQLYQCQGCKKPQYLMSLKDICSLELIPQLIESGITSFKIEGRMKKPEYVAGVVSMYRKYTDLYLELFECFHGDSQKIQNAYSVKEEDKQMLMDLYNRGGFHTGYYKTRNGREMVSLDKPNHAGVAACRVEKKQGRMIFATALTNLNGQDVIELPLRPKKEKNDNYTLKDAVRKGQKIQIPAFADTPVKAGDILMRVRNSKLIDHLTKTYLDTKIKEKLKGVFILSEGKSATLVVRLGNVVVTVSGDAPLPAENAPVTSDRIEKQLRKTGNTDFEFAELEVQVEGNLFYPMQSLNELRRTALEKLEAAVAAQYRREEAAVSEDTVAADEKCRDTYLRVLVSDLDQAAAVLEADEVDRVYIESAAFKQIYTDQNLKEALTELRSAGKELFLAMPYVFREETRWRFDRAYEAVFEAGWDGVLIRNLESYQFLLDHQYPGKIMTDANLYQMNKQARSFWAEKGVEEYTLPVELNEQEIKKLKAYQGEFIAYGYLPMMISAGCIRKTTGKCLHQPGYTMITDKFQNTFAVRNECDYCYNVTYNSAPLYLADRLDEVRMTGVKKLRLQFTRESKAKVKEVLEAYREGYACGEEEFTRGHFKRGIK